MIGKTISHYKIIEKLGEGGMGVVYKAEDTKLKRTVALKFLPPQWTRDSEAKARFIHEAQAASALEHNNICNVHEIDETEDGQMFIAMACYEGESLQQKIERGPLKVEEAIDIAMQIARGLDKAHQKEIAHRDIKPANVMTTSDGVVKLLDFGLAKLVGRTMLTEEGTTLGTMAYMSPEQTEGANVDYRTDIWSLGVLLYEILTGQQPFRGDYDQAVVYSIVNEEAEPVTGLRTGVPLELERIVNKCLKKESSHRYQHVDEILVDLKSLQERMQADTSPGAAKIRRQRPKESVEALLTPAYKRRFVIIAAPLILGLIAALGYLYFRGGEKKLTSDKKMIAVLPFENLGPPEDEYFADGITEEITSRLASIRELGVISRTSAMRYKNTNKSIKQIGEELGVGHVLEGTVRWERPAEGASRVRITPQLIKVSDDIHLWSQSYDRELDQIFKVQSELAEEVIRQLGITLLGAETGSLDARPTENHDAYQAYLRGVAAVGRLGYDPEDQKLAIRMFRRAVELDPNFALAYIEQAKCHLFLYHLGKDRTEERHAQAKVAVDKALELQPNLSEAHFVMGFHHYAVHRDYENALKEFAIAEKGLPNKSELMAFTGYVLRAQGQYEEALVNLNKARELNPRSVELTYDLATTYMSLRNNQMAELLLDQTISLAPDYVAAYVMKAHNLWQWKGDARLARELLEGMPGSDHPFIVVFRGYYEFMERKYQEALAHFSSFPQEIFANQGYLYPKAFLLAIVYDKMRESELAQAAYDSARLRLEKLVKERPQDHRVHSALGHTYAGLGQTQEAIRHGIRAAELSSLKDIPQLQLTLIYTRIGKFDAALDRIEYLLSVPSDALSVASLRGDPRWDALREHPRFKQLLEKYGGESQ